MGDQANIRNNAGSGISTSEYPFTQSREVHKDLGVDTRCLQAREETPPPFKNVLLTFVLYHANI